MRAMPAMPAMPAMAGMPPDGLLRNTVGIPPSQGPSMRTRLPALVFLAALAALPAPPLGAGERETRLQAVDRADYHRLTPDEPDGVYHVHVRMPESHEPGADRRYPAVYLLDGGNMFPLLAGYYRYLELGEEVPELILVSVSYGTDYFREGNQRSRDYTAEAPEPEFWGGADAFLGFLREALIPLVESRYPADPERRVILGQSLGGQFVLYSALQPDAPFWGHIAINPALHRNLPLFLEAPGKTFNGPRRRLYLASGADDLPRFRGPALSWIGHWTMQQDTPWDLEAEILPGESHFSAAPPAFRRGIRWLFGMEEPISAPATAQ